MTTTTTTTIHDSPATVTTELEGPSRETPEVKTSIKIIAIAVPLLSFAGDHALRFSGMILDRSVDFLDIVALFYNLVITFLVPLIVMLLFQIGKRFRNPRSRWFIFLNTALAYLGLQLLGSVGKVFKLLSMLAP